MITNRSNYPDVDFVPEDEIRPIGTIGGVRLVYLGKEQGSGSLVVATSYAPTFTPTEDFFAVPLNSLYTQTQDTITITEKIA